MSVTDPEPDAAQPDEGQGDTASEAPYAEYLSRFNEERDIAEEAFKAWDANTTQKFQDAADFRKTWEPFQETGIHQLPVEEVQWLTQFRQALDDPQTMKQWWDGYAQQNGLTEPSSPAETPPPADDFGSFPDPQQQLEQLLKDQLGPLQEKLEAMSQWRTSLEDQARQNQVSQQIEHEVSQLKTQHAAQLPAELRDQFEEIIERFGQKYATPGADPKQVVAKAWADFSSLTNQIEKAALQAKVDAPAPAEGGGVPDVNPEKIRDFKHAEEVAKQFLRNENRG